MILEIIAKRGVGCDAGASKVFTISVKTDKQGKIHLNTARKIVEWVNGELRRREAEMVGEKYDPDLEAEFKGKRSFRRRE